MPPRDSESMEPMHIKGVIRSTQIWRTFCSLSGAGGKNCQEEITCLSGAPHASRRRRKGRAAGKPVGQVGQVEHANSWRQLLRSVRVSVWFFQPILALTFVFMVALPAADSPTAAMLRAKQAQEIVNELCLALSIDKEVQIGIVAHHPLVFSVERADRNRDRFMLSMEVGFLLMLDEDELRAALAHELGHVWIFTHHPYLHTERLANDVGLRVVSRVSFEKVYTKLWAYEGTAGVPLEQLLGPDSRSLSGVQ
jgi:hypothetical protein